MRPDRFRAVVGMSVPFAPRSRVNTARVLRDLFGGDWFYQVWFAEPGVAEAVLDPQAERFLAGFFFTLSNDCPGEPTRGLAGGGPGGDIFDRLTVPDQLPAWFTTEDLTYYAGEFSRTGFRGPLNWYRCLGRNWELGRAFGDRRVEQPALYVAGDRDAVLTMAKAGVDNLRANVPGLVDAVVVPDCGHWTQQEQPAAVNEALLTFLAGLP